MRALFRKEWRQSYLIPWSGFILSAMIAVLYWWWSRSYVESIRDEENLDLFCATCLLAAVSVMLLIATAGLFSSEKTRGTLPCLLGLPLSRSRIWLTKALSAAALAGSAALLLILPVWLALPQVIGEVKLWLYVPDILCYGLLILSVTLFFATLLERTISVLLASLLVASQFVGISFLLAGSGGAVLGYDILLDGSIWALAFSVPFLGASLLTFNRGEMLRSARKWAFALPTLVIGLAITFGAVVLVTRYAFRYQRSAIEVMDSAWMPAGGSAAAVPVRAAPAPFQRDVARGWAATRGPYRSAHTVAVDTETGRELLVRRGMAIAASSVDGRRLALVGGRAPLTWAESDHVAQTPQRLLEVWDLEAHRLLYHGSPERPVGGRILSLTDPCWSPGGDWLGMRVSYLTDESQEAILLMRPDASEFVAIPISARAPYVERSPPADWVADWALARDWLYTLEVQGRIARRHLPRGKAETVWEAAASPDLPGLPAGWQWRFHRLSVSPSGQWIAVAGTSVGDEEAQEARVPPVTVVVSADGARATVIAQPVYGQFVWSPDGRSLYVVGTRDGRPQVHRWREGETEARTFHAPPGEPASVWAVVPRSDGIALWERPNTYGEEALDKTRAYLVSQEGQFVSLPGRALRAVAWEGNPVGTDSRGRLVVRKWDGKLAAADPSTGRVTAVYP